MAEPTEADKLKARVIAAPGDYDAIVGGIASALAEAREEGERIGESRARRQCWRVAEHRREVHSVYIRGAAFGPTHDVGVSLQEAAAIRDAIAASGPMEPEP